VFLITFSRTSTKLRSDFLIRFRMRNDSTSPNERSDFQQGTLKEAAVGGSVLIAPPSMLRVEEITSHVHKSSNTPILYTDTPIQGLVQHHRHAHGLAQTQQPFPRTAAHVVAALLHRQFVSQNLGDTHSIRIKKTIVPAVIRQPGNLRRRSLKDFWCSAKTRNDGDQIRQHTSA